MKVIVDIGERGGISLFGLRSSDNFTYPNASEILAAKLELWEKLKPTE